MTTLDQVPVDRMLAEIERRAEAAHSLLSKDEARRDPSSSAPGPDGIVRAYLDSLTISGYRPATLRTRRFVLAAFARTITPRDLTQATVLDVTAWLSRPLKPESRRAYRSTLKSAGDPACGSDGGLSQAGRRGRRDRRQSR